MANHKKILILLMALSSSTVFSASFQAIGLPLTGSTYVGGISSDKTIVGHSENWVWSNGTYTVPSYPGLILGISDDSSTIIGSVPNGNVFYKVTNGVTEIIAGPVSGLLFTTPTAISANGSKVVGKTRGQGNQQTPSWIYENGSYTLLPLPSGAEGINSLHISSDGSVIAGTVWGGNATGHIVTWEHGSVNVLPNPAGEYFVSCQISGDGSTVIAGHYRWQNGTVDTLPILAGATSSNATAVSFDGSLVFGNSYDGGNAFIWDKINGTRVLKDFLEDDYGLNLAGWNLLSVSATDASGNIITGYGIDPQGQGELWVATIPEPATLLLFGFGLLGLKKRRFY